MGNPPGEFGRAEQIDPPDLGPDGSAGRMRADGLLGPFEGAEEHLFHVREIVADQERLIDLDQQEVDGILAGLKDRTPATLPGVDTSALKQVDPEFDNEAFRAIARETFYKVREARSQENQQESTELLSPQMRSELQNEISGDVASHRHRLLPFLTVNDAVIAGAQVVDGHEEIDVRFSISAAEKDVDDRTGQVLAGDNSEHSWEEVWRFTRDPSADTSARDEWHEITNVRADQWMVAHRGWVVTEIARLPAN